MLHSFNTFQIGRALSSNSLVAGEVRDRELSWIRSRWHIWCCKLQTKMCTCFVHSASPVPPSDITVWSPAAVQTLLISGRRWPNMCCRPHRASQTQPNIIAVGQKAGARYSK